MKTDMAEAYVYRSRTITPLNEVDCTRDVETRPRNRRLTQCRACRVIVCASTMYSAEQRVFTAREYWRKGSHKQCQRAFWNKSGKEVYDKILYSQIGEIIRENGKCFDSEDV
jgi:hypothetical protein